MDAHWRRSGAGLNRPKGTRLSTYKAISCRLRPSSCRRVVVRFERSVSEVPTRPGRALPVDSDPGGDHAASPIVIGRGDGGSLRMVVTGDRPGAGFGAAQTRPPSTARYIYHILIGVYLTKIDSYQKYVSLQTANVCSGFQTDVSQMTYERTRQIEQRFRRAVCLIEGGPVDAQRLADALKVSRPTAHRIVTELRRRGFSIRSIRDEQGWRYELLGKPSGSAQDGESV
jgi:hypothetical protein